MRAMVSKLGTLLWFLKQPKLHSELIRTMRLQISGLFASDTRKEAERWCAERAISTSDAIVKITRSPMPEPVEERFTDVFVAASSAREYVQRSEGVVMPPAGPANLDLLYWLAEHLQAE